MNRLRKLRRLIRHSEARARTLRAHRRYRCEKCGAEGVRLFRRYSFFTDHTPLFCGPCACKEQRRVESDYMARDQIYGMVAAVPVNTARVDAGKPTECTFWGYTSVPEKSVRWWLSLPWRKGTA